MNGLRGHDVLVIGGGPAGLAAAIAARLKGFTVTVADGATPPIDKACGEGILPAGVEVLRRLGVPPSASDGFPIRGIRFLSDSAVVDAPFPSGCGIALRRTCLHEMLIDRASELGVRMHWATPVTEVIQSASYRWIVGADGEHSRVRRLAGLDAGAHQSTRFGYRQHYRLPPWTDFVEVHWGHRCQIYVTPVGHDEVGVAVLSRDSHLRLEDALHEFPELQRRLRLAPASSSERGAVTLSRWLLHVFRGRMVLIGDASGSVDAITGEGLSLSFRQAVLLSEAFCRDDLMFYQAEHRRLSRRPAHIAQLLLLLDRLPALRRNVFRLLAAKPPFFQDFLLRHALNC